MFCDNVDVYKNASTPELKLKNNKISIFYHKCREAVAARLDRIDKDGKYTSLADLFTNILVHIRRETLLDKFTY